MFRRNAAASKPDITPIERVTSVLGAGIIWRGSLNGKGGVRVEGTFEGEINLNGLLVVGETGRITCENVRANTVIVAGAIKGNITAEKLEIRSTGHVWGDVTIVAFSRNITMEEQVALDFPQPTEEEASFSGDESSQDSPE